MFDGPFSGEGVDMYKVWIIVVETQKVFAFHKQAMIF